MPKIVTNESKKNVERTLLSISDSIHSENPILIATAFFSNFRLVQKISEHHLIRLLIRLADGTSGEALQTVIQLDNVEIRYYTGKHFHPKFYIAGNKVILGSANLTESGVRVNQEVCVLLDDNESNQTLRNIFKKYWDRARQLDEETVKKFIDWQNRREKQDESDDEEDQISRWEYSEPNSFINDYKKFIDAFDILREDYKRTGLRKFPTVPLNLEIDKFLYWRNSRVGQDLVAELNNADLLGQINCFLGYDSQAIEESISLCLEIRRQGRLINWEKISDQTILKFLNLLYSFRQYHTRWGQNDLIQMNGSIEVRRTIRYLIQGDDDPMERIHKCLKGEYRIAGFGQNSITELFGCVFIDDYPIETTSALNGLTLLGYIQ